MDLGLTGRVALVAAGSSGLGLATAREFAAEGAHVAIGARDPARLEAARAAIDAAGPGRVLAVPVDVGDPAAVRAWVARCAEELGAPGVLVASSGPPPQGGAMDFDLDAYRAGIELNLLSQISLAQAVLPYLVAAGWGRILFVTSSTVRQANPGLALSGVARAGVVGYAKALVGDLAARGVTGVTVNVLAPGRIRTPRLESLAGPDVEGGLARMAAALPLGRVGQPREFAAAAAFLASARAAYITGATLSVDGGEVNALP